MLFNLPNLCSSSVFSVSSLIVVFDFFDLFDFPSKCIRIKLNGEKFYLLFSSSLFLAFLCSFSNCLTNLVKVSKTIMRRINKPFFVVFFDGSSSLSFSSSKLKINTYCANFETKSLLVKNRITKGVH